MSDVTLLGILLFAVQLFILLFILYWIVRSAVRGALRDNQEALEKSIRVVMYEMERRRERANAEAKRAAEGA